MLKKVAAKVQEYTDSFKSNILCKIRLNSQIVYSKTFITNRTFYLQIMDNHEDEIDKDIKCLVNNFHLRKRSKKCVQPIGASFKNLYKVITWYCQYCWCLWNLYRAQGSKLAVVSRILQLYILFWQPNFVLTLNVIINLMPGFSTLKCHWHLTGCF